MAEDSRGRGTKAFLYQLGAERGFFRGISADFFGDARLEEHGDLQHEADLPRVEIDRHGFGGSLFHSATPPLNGPNDPPLGLCDQTIA